MEVNNNPDNNGMLYFVVGVLVIGLIGLGFYYAGPHGARDTGNTVTIEKTYDTTPNTTTGTGTGTGTYDNNTK